MGLLALLIVLHLPLHSAFRKSLQLGDFKLDDIDEQHIHFQAGPALNISLHSLASTPQHEDRLVAFWTAAISTFLVAAALVVGGSLQMSAEAKRMQENVPHFPIAKAKPVDSAADSSDSDGSFENQQRNSSSTFIMPPDSMRRRKLRRAFKAHWLLESNAVHLSRSAWWLSCLMPLIGFCRLVQFSARPNGYQTGTLPGGLNLEEAELIVVSVVFVLSMLCYFRPRDALYWPLFLFYCFYIPAQGLPPFATSCTQLKKENTSVDWLASDCSLQGISEQHLFMAAILMLPWLVPRVKMLSRLAWTWVALYAVWACLYSYIMKERILTVLECLTRLTVFCIAMGISCCWKFYLDKSQRNRVVNHLQYRHAVKQMLSYYQYMLPEHVLVPMMRNPLAPIAEHLECVSILSISISEFEQLAQRLPPYDLLRFLNENFSYFDKVCEELGVTRIETRGAAYVVCVGVSPSDINLSKEKNHGETLKKLFMVADKILKSQSSKVKFRMGMHTGPIVAGVIGQKLPHYRLFGDTFDTAARMMQTNATGKLQFGEETFKELPVTVVAKLQANGKGMVQTYLFDSILTDSHLKKSGAASRKARKSIWRRGCADAQFDLSDMPSDNEEVLKREVGEIVRGHRGEPQPLMNGSVADGSVRDRVLTDCLVHKYSFGQEMEEDWYWNHHLTRVCDRLGIRLTRYMFWFAALTLLEMLYVLSDRSSPAMPMPFRMATFLVFRALPFCMLLFCRLVVIKSEWLLHKPFQVQTCILGIQCLVAIVHFFSYTAITGTEEREQAAWVRAWMRDPDYPMTFDQAFTLNYVLFFYLSTGQQNLLFRPSLVFVGLACVLMITSSYLPVNGLVFPFLPKVLFLGMAVTNCVLAREDEQSSRSRFRSKYQIKKTDRKIEDMLNTLMPPLVAEHFRQSSSHALPPSHQYHKATVAQCKLCGLTKLTCIRSPADVVDFTSELLARFDALADQFSIYKVETVGDAYIAAMAEEPLTAKNSPTDMINFGIAMVNLVNEWAVKMGIGAECRVGVHHGTCIGGVVGNEMQLYQLFGHVMTGVEVLESTAPEGLVQVSQACKDAVEQEKEKRAVSLDFLSDSGLDEELRVDFSFEERSADFSADSEAHAFKELGGRTYLVQFVPPPPLAHTSSYLHSASHRSLREK